MIFILNFIQLLKKSNIRISISEIIDLHKAFNEIELYEKNDFKFTIRNCLIKDYSDFEKFNILFETYFKTQEQLEEFKNEFNEFENMFNNFSLEPNLDDSKSINDEVNDLYEELKEIPINELDNKLDNYNTEESIKQQVKYKIISNFLQNNLDKLDEVFKDEDYVFDIKFLDYNNIEDKDIQKALNKLCKKLNDIYTRKKIKSNKGKINIKKTIKNFMNPKLIYKKNKKDKNKLIILADISGSMKEYVNYILQVIYNIQQIFENVQVFVFMEKAAKLKNIEYIKQYYESDMLGFGTDYNNTFFMMDLKKIYNNKTNLLIIGDGLNSNVNTPTGINYLYSIKSKTKNIFWLNPLEEEKWINDYKRMSKMYKCKNLRDLENVIKKLI